MKVLKSETPGVHDLENAFSSITLNEVPSKTESEIERKLSNLTLQEEPKVCKNYYLEKLKSCNLEGPAGVFGSYDEKKDVPNKSLYRYLKHEIEENVTVNKTNKDGAFKEIPSELSEFKTREVDCQNSEVLRKRGPIKLCSVPKHDLSSPYGATSSYCTWISKPSTSSHNLNDPQVFFPGGDILLSSQVRTVENEPGFTSAENLQSFLPDFDHLLSCCEEMSKNEFVDWENLDIDDGLPNDLEDINLEKLDMAPPVLDFSNLETLFFQDSEISQTSPISVPPNISPYPNDQFSPRSDDTGYTSDLSDNRSCSNSPISTVTTVIGGRPKLTLLKPNMNSVPNDRISENRNVQKRKESYNSLDSEISQIFPIAAPHNMNPYPEDQFSPQSDNTFDLSDNRCYSNPPGTKTLMTVIGKPRLILPKQNINSLPNERKSDTRNVQKRNKFYVTLDPKLCDKYQRTEKDKDFGQKSNDGKNRNILQEAICAGDITKAVVMINILEKHFKNDNPKARREGLSSFNDLPSYLNQRDYRGWTALYTACVKNLTLVVENLLECGADLTLSEESTGDSVFHYAAREGIQDLKLLEILCTRSSDCLNLKNLKGRTPLHIAIQYRGCSTKRNRGNDILSLIKFLLEHRARLSFTDSIGQTPLHWIICYNQLDLLTYMYNYGCDWDEAVNIQNYQGRTALHLAVIGKGIDYEDQKRVVRELIVRNASTAILDSEGKCSKDLVPESKTDLIAILNEEWIQKFGFASGEEPTCSA